MKARSSNPDQFLQKVGGTYYARVRVPRTLEEFTGQSHIRKSLQTGDKAEANRRKHAVVASLKAELEKLRKAPPSPTERGISFADARAWREDLKALEAAQDHDNAEQLESLAVDRAEEVERLYGHERARKWFRTATTDNETLSELMGKWLGVSDYRESTKAGHRKALAEVLEHIKDPDALPQDITLKVAVDYIDNGLTQRKLAHSTIRDRLVSLGGFWGWMATRGAVPQGSNPWARHKVSKAQNKGTRPEKRKGGFTPEELVRLLKGNDRVRSWPTWSYLPDLMVLGMFTGSRLEKLCDLTPAKVKASGDAFILSIQGDKTDAGDRLVGVVHPAAVAVIRRRIKDKKAGDSLFHELTPGGLDDKMSSSASKAFGRYRRACEVPDGTDFHSYRRVVVDVLLAGRMEQVEIARYIGHKVGTLLADTYAGQSLSPERTIEVARRVRYPEAVEAAAGAVGAS